MKFNSRHLTSLKPMAGVGVSSAILLSLCACQPVVPSARYFPLESGHAWTYSVTTEFENQKTERETLVLRNRGKEDLADAAAWHRQSSTGMNYWLRQDETGIYRVASRPELQEQYQVDAPHRYVLKEPLIAGTQWQASTTAYILHRPNDFPREIRHSHPVIPMLYTLEAVKQSIETTAGHFDDCLRVRGVGAVRLFVDPVMGWKDMPLKTREWYCSGVGLVKLVREEPAGSSFLGGGTMTLELKEWK
ncbi:MAG: hypothetical protein WCG50_10110 [Rhodoferax sp.]|uniref:hypothetical protein n=1 Tax=Rhodoferax sp. TaxID=50421 RepID=UPI0030171D10